MTPGFRKSARAGAAALLVAVTFASCGGDGPITPPPPRPAAPQIACGTGLTVNDVIGDGQAVVYQVPASTGGTQPVGVTCTPAPASTFPLGTTTVTCTASDGDGRVATCSFPVTLRHRAIPISRVLTFGDSMTAGENGRPVNLVPVIDLPNAYPTILQELFSTRLPGQPVVVVNEGVSGERATQSNARLKGELAQHQPQVLLLLEGINDVMAGVSTDAIVQAIEDHIRTARDRGVAYVFVSTLLPLAPDNCSAAPGAPPCRGNRVPLAAPEAVNQELRAVVPAAGAFLVDPYQEFLANKGTYIDLDGLHLRPEGNRALANAFWNRMAAVIPPSQFGGR